MSLEKREKTNRKVLNPWRKKQSKAFGRERSWGHPIIL